MVSLVVSEDPSEPIKNGIPSLSNVTVMLLSEVFYLCHFDSIILDLVFFFLSVQIKRVILKDPMLSNN